LLVSAPKQAMKKMINMRLTIGAKDIAVHSSLFIREVVLFFVIASYRKSKKIPIGC
jgi:hypothetical protein